jgi:hypothetical protein
MKITKISPFSRKEHTLEINVSQEQLDRWYAGTLIQHAMPHLTPDEREFLMTGITAEEWKETFGDDQDSDPKGND